LLGLDQMTAVFKLIEASVPREYDSLDKAIAYTNDLNRGFEMNEPTVTKEGILCDDAAQCKALFNRIAVEIDQRLQSLDFIEGIDSSRQAIDDSTYKFLFERTARNIYECITGQPCPTPINIW